MQMTQQLVLNAHLETSYITSNVCKHVQVDITKIRTLDGVLNADVIAQNARAMMSAQLVLAFPLLNHPEFVQFSMDRMLRLCSNLILTIKLLSLFGREQVFTLDTELHLLLTAQAHYLFARIKFLQKIGLLLTSPQI